MQRRNFLIGAAGTAIGGSALVGSGAYDVIRAERDVTVDVEGDESAYLALDDLDNEYASGTDGGELAVNFAGGNGQNGDGINENAKTQFNDVFKIEHQGTQDVQLTVGTNNDVGYDLNNPLISATDESVGQTQWFLGSDGRSADGLKSTIGDVNQVYELTQQNFDQDTDDDNGRVVLTPGDEIWVHFLFDNLEEIVSGADDPEDLEALTFYAAADTA